MKKGRHVAFPRQGAIPEPGLPPFEEKAEQNQDDESSDDSRQDTGNAESTRGSEPKETAQPSTEEGAADTKNGREYESSALASRKDEFCDDPGNKAKGHPS